MCDFFQDDRLPPSFLGVGAFDNLPTETELSFDSQAAYIFQFKATEVWVLKAHQFTRSQKTLSFFANACTIPNSVSRISSIKMIPLKGVSMRELVHRNKES